MDETIQQLVNEIINLGRDDKTRAKALKVSPRTISDYKTGKFPRIVSSLLEQGIVVLRVEDLETSLFSTSNEAAKEA